MRRTLILFGCLVLTALVGSVMYAIDPYNAFARTDGGLALGLGLDSDVQITFNQATGQDPAIVWDDSAAAFEFDADANIGDGADPFINGTSVSVPTSFIIEGTVDAFETILVATDATADRTITFPNSSGTVLLAATGNFTYGDGTAADITLTFDDDSTDPKLVWDNSATKFEWNWDSNTNDGLDVGIGDASIFVPTSIIIEGSVDAFETTIAATDATADVTATFPDDGGFVRLWDNLGTTEVNLVFEGATANDFETTLTVTDPTADRTFTFADQSGTVLVNGGLYCTSVYAVEDDPDETGTEYSDIVPLDATPFDATEANTDYFTVPVAMNAHSLRVSNVTDPTAGKTWTITLREAGASTTLTCQITNGNTGCMDTSNIEPIAAGAKLNWMIAAAATPAAGTTMNISFCLSP